MPPTDLAFATIEQIAALYRKRKLSPVELTKLMLERIEQINPKINAYITITSEVALAQAKKAEAELFAPNRKSRKDRGPLHGIPISLKDNIYTKGIRTTAGSSILRDLIPSEDADVVSRLYDSGAILLGKTNMHEFAYGVTTNNPHYGPTRNPWNLSRIPGGSSGGSAAAVAAGLCYASIGTDTGGSIRIPSSLCGTVGFKPMRGQISDDRIIPLSPILDCTGPIARTTNDAAATFYAAASTRESFRSPWTRKRALAAVRKLKVAIPEEFFFDVLDPEVQSAFDSAISCLKQLGVEIKTTSIPSLNNTEGPGNQIAWVEATHYHQEAGFYPQKSAEYGEDVRTRIEMGTKILGTEYLHALKCRSEFIYELVGRMHGQNLAALVVPTTAIAAPQINEEKTLIAGKEHPTRALLLRLNRPANLASVPAISVPCGFTKSGLPIGLQLIGLHAQHSHLLNIAHAYEIANDWHTHHPEL